MAMKNGFYDKLRQYQYYIIIGITSLFALFFLPMIGSAAGLAWTLPNTATGWVVYVTSKILIAGINILIFHCFVSQGKVNSQDHPNYIKANELLATVEKDDEYTPRSPKQWNAATYGKKATTIFITSVLSAVGLTQAVLTFDWISMLTYFFTLVMGVIFGILQMNSTELYWTDEYYNYAKKSFEENKRAMELDAKNAAKQENDSSCDTGGTDLLVSPDSDSVDSSAL